MGMYLQLQQQPPLQQVLEYAQCSEPPGLIWGFAWLVTCDERCVCQYCPDGPACLIHLALRRLDVTRSARNLKTEETD